ncbi:acyl carrier protein [Micromonospora sp. CB01531]|uniref:acyl carrier protein n=1 Tax=Micromonospora sp. CB01531 TaxID=1718947 RepID=UPI000A5C64CC|nr:acyl carrier protein [Micromonospora sp. CB01531]
MTGNEKTVDTRPHDGEQVEQLVLGVLAEILYSEAKDIDPAAAFTELGIDSILVVELCAALRERTGTTITAATVYECATPQKLTAHLLHLAASDEG